MLHTRSFTRWLILVLVAALALVALAACSSDEDDDKAADDVADIVVSDPWVRATVAADSEGESTETGMITGAFMVIENSRDEDDALVGVSVDASVAAVAELHETTIDDNDVMQMRQVETIALPANSTVELKPGSYHIMLIDVLRELTPGDTVSLTLAFESGKTFAVDAEVRAMDS